MKSPTQLLKGIPVSTLPASPIGPEPAAPESAQVHGRGTAMIAFLALGGLAFAVLQSLVAPALGTIGNELGVSGSDASWILTAYLLAAAVLTPVFSRLGDMVGKRKIIIVVLVILLVGTILAALAPTLIVLVIARVLQGSAGAILPLSIGIVRDELPKERVPTSIGLLSAIFGIGAGIGIVAAGPIVEHLSWQWLFWLPAVLVVIALLGAIFGMPESPIRTPGRLDLVGAGIFAIGLTALLLTISEGRSWGWDDPKTIGLLVLGVVGLIVFVIVELRVRQPLIDIRLFTHRGVWSAHLVALAVGFAMFGTFILVPTVLQLPTVLDYGFGKSVTESGLFLLITVVTLIIFSVVAGVIIHKIGPKVPMVIGAVALAIAFVIPALGHGEIWQIVLSGVLTGVGIGLALAATSNAIVESVPATHTSEAISANTVIRTVGSSIGTAAIATILASNVTEQGIPMDSAFTAAFWMCAAVAVLAIIAALAAPSLKARRREAEEAGVEDFEALTTAGD